MDSRGTERLARAAVAPILAVLPLFGGCSIFDEAMLRSRLLEEPYPQVYRLAAPLDEVWRAVVRQVERRPIERVLGQDPTFAVASWAERGAWSDCVTARDSGGASPATLVWVVRLSQAVEGTELFVRVTCYRLDNTKSDHEHSLGRLENAFANLVEQDIER